MLKQETKLSVYIYRTLKPFTIVRNKRPIEILDRVVNQKYFDKPISSFKKNKFYYDYEGEDIFQSLETGYLLAHEYIKFISSAPFMDREEIKKRYKVFGTETKARPFNITFGSGLYRYKKFEKDKH